MEQRFAATVAAAPLRSRAAGGARVPGIGMLRGIAAPFDTPAHIGGFRETIKPGAFAKSLARAPDIRALVDHDDGKLLGRTRSGSLRLYENEAGLNYEIDLPDTTLGRDVYALAKRGDLSGMSFGFTVPPDGETWPNSTARELRAVDLAEISVLHRLPAYDSTTIAARAKALGRAEAAARIRRIAML